jgi:predicted RNase H-like HicB family nuclease
MKLRACVEEAAGRWIAHVPEFPACFARGSSCEDALSLLPDVVLEYRDWVVAHRLPGADELARDAVTGSHLVVEVEEIVRAWRSKPEYEVNAFFASDRPALTRAEIDRAVPFLEATRRDLLAAAREVPEALLDREIPGEQPVRKLLLHVGGAEWWYLDCLEAAFPKSDLPRDPWERLERVRTAWTEALPRLANDDRLLVRDCEVWSARKALRRALWHERAHTAQLRRILEALLT